MPCQLLEVAAGGVLLRIASSYASRSSEGIKVLVKFLRPLDAEHHRLELP
jgi:hypothetical protein